MSRHHYSESIRVLVVDDEPGLADTTAAFLEREHGAIEADTATSAGDGSARLDDEPLDCVVSDYDMPGTNGLEFLESVRDAHPDIPFILFTGKGSEEIASRAISAGVTDYLQKAGGTEQYEVLANRIEQAVSRQRAERNYREIFDKATDGIVLHDPGTARILDVNRRFCELVGYSRDEVVEMSVGDFSAGSEGFTQTEAERRIRRAAEEGPQQFEWAIETGSGERRPVEVHLKQTTISGTERVLAFVRDISERKEHEQEIALKNRAMDEASIGILITDPSREDNPIVYANEGFEELTGYDEQDVLGRNCRFLQGPDTGPETVAEMREAIDEERPVSVEVLNYRKDGTPFWNQVRITPIHDREGEVAHFLGFQQDVTDRKRQERRLAGLNGMLGEFLLTDERQGLCNVTVGTAADRLGLPTTAIALFDDERGALRPTARTPRAQKHLDESLLLDQEGGVAWEAFTAGEPVVLDDLDRHSPFVSASPVTRLFVYPLGRHGVFMTAIEASDDALDTETAFVETVVGNLKSGLDSIEREEMLREREARLQEQNEWLDRLNRINDVIRRIDEVLVGATTREGIERTVCEELVSEGPYRFAWIGAYGPSTDRIEPQARAGDERGFLDAITDDADTNVIPPDADTDTRPSDTDTNDACPTVRTARTHEPTVIGEVMTEPPLAPWRKAALDRGFRSCMAIPLSYRDRLYGVLTVYADEPNSFDELERETLTELGATIAHAINAIESTRALVSDDVIELEFEIDPAEIPFLEPLNRLPDCEIELDGVVPAADGYRVFVTLGSAGDDLVERLERSPVVRECTVIAEREGTSVFECTLTHGSFVAWLLDHRAVPRSIGLGDRATVTVELPREADVREFVELVRGSYPGTELIARRERERAARSRATLRSEIEERLTPRQREILRTAYLSGFFDTPRERTGRQIAASLGISQPTFSDHLRAAQRKLLDILYGDGDRDDEQT